MIIMYDHLSLFSGISPRAHSANWEHNRVLKQSYLMNFFIIIQKSYVKHPVIVSVSRIDFLLSVTLPAILQANELRE